MSFSESFKKIVAAVDTHAVEGLGDVTAVDGMLMADDGRLCAAVPFEWVDSSFSARAVPLAKAFKTFGETAKLVDKEDRVQIRSGRRSVTVQKAKVTREFKMPEGDKIALPKDFPDGLKKMALFMSDDKTKPTVCALLIREEQIFACNNIIAATTSVATGEMDVTLPDYCVNYLTKRADPPTHYSMTDTRIYFYFADDSWIRASLLGTDMPQQVVDLCLAAVNADTAPIGAEWLSHVKTLMELSEDEIKITADKMTAQSLFGIAKAEIDFPTPIEGETIWHPKFLKMVLATATEFDLSAYPKPCAFAGNSIAGFIVGRR